MAGHDARNPFAQPTLSRPISCAATVSVNGKPRFGFGSRRRGKMKMANSLNNSIAYLFSLGALIAPLVHAEDEPQNEYGLRANVLLGDGTPANDILGIGLIGRRYLDHGWFIGGSLDTYAYDFERPAALLDITQDPDSAVIDADAKATVLGGFLGREYGDANTGFRWFWTLGLGAGTSSVNDLRGAVDGGGTFDLEFDTGTDIQLMSTLGTSWYFSSKWSASFTARFEHHFTDIRITDRVSGATRSIDSQSPLGGYVSINYRF